MWRKTGMRKEVRRKEVRRKDGRAERDVQRGARPEGTQTGEGVRVSSLRSLAWECCPPTPRRSEDKANRVSELVEIELSVNGTRHNVSVPPTRSLLECLRYDLGLTGSKEGCGIGVCGACTVRMDGTLVSGCLQLAVLAEGSEITTIEALADGDSLHPVQQAFVDNGGFQCGICTPGMVMSAVSLLEAHPDPSEAEIEAWMRGNLCRCTGYRGIVDSIRAAARDQRARRAGESS